MIYFDFYTRGPSKSLSAQYASAHMSTGLQIDGIGYFLFERKWKRERQSGTTLSYLFSVTRELPLHPLAVAGLILNDGPIT